MPPIGSDSRNRYRDERAPEDSGDQLQPAALGLPLSDRESRPTLSDIDVLPRRRLRDGSASTSTSTSRSSSGVVGPPSFGGNVRTRFAALRDESLQRARNGVPVHDSASPASSTSTTSAPAPRKAKKRTASVISISSDDEIELIEPVKSAKGRWTAKEKGKGRAVMASPPSPGPVAAAAKLVEGFKDDENIALGQYSCPICLSRPSQPVMTPCGHLMCGACLHLTLLTSIIRDLPGTPSTASSSSADETRRRRREIRASIAHVQPPYALPDRARGSVTTLKHINRLSWVGPDKPGNANMLAMRMMEDPKIWDEDGLMKPRLGDHGGWLLDGLCPVCRKDLKGGLGPRGYGSVIHLEPRKV